ncbi:LPS translocon maturation chaperone LptM [Ottowia sp.]|uniref:LPS translocon maturation chaperone LptM n=1 Tax=Ottowia sp. TaxID=1898956 RepID=UPI003A8C6B8B
MLMSLQALCQFSSRFGRFILATGLASGGLLGLSACGQKGPLFIPDTSAAAQRATLPQTMYGGAPAISPPASAASASTPIAVPAPALPNQPDIE